MPSGVLLPRTYRHIPTYRIRVSSLSVLQLVNIGNTGLAGLWHCIGTVRAPLARTANLHLDIGRIEAARYINGPCAACQRFTKWARLRANRDTLFARIDFAFRHDLNRSGFRDDRIEGNTAGTNTQRRLQTRDTCPPGTSLFRE